MSEPVATGAEGAPQSSRSTTASSAAPRRARRSSDRCYRQKQRRRRRLRGAALLAAPGLWLLLSDLLRRWAHIRTFDQLHTWGYLATVAASLLFWAVLLYNAARTRGWLRQLAAGLFVTLYTLSVGVQAAFHAFYNVYLSHDGQIYSRSLPWALLGDLPLSEPKVGLRVGGTLLLALGLVILARRWVRPRPIWRSYVAPPLCLLVLIGMSQIPASYRMWQSTSPDIIYFHGYQSLIRERLRQTEHAPHLRVQRRWPEPMPELTARPARPRNVLFILQESLRYDICCNTPGDNEDCATPFSGRATPSRYDFHQVRANAATTAISISNLWHGLSPLESYERLHSAPMLWEYAHAAGYYTAYWTSQNVMFGSMRLYIQDFPADIRVTATQLDPKADYDAGALDALLSDRVITDWDDLEEPFFGVVQYSNVHFPYVYDAKHAPFQPSEFTKAASKNQHFINYYKNVVYLSDIGVGRLLRHIKGTDKGRRTVIVYTSDHGESFREHWQLGHTSSLYDEEIKTPGWIDAPAGTLSPEEERSLRQAKEQFIWHLDYPPTMLDLLGVWDLPEIARFRARMIGHPITRPQRTVGPVPLSNCSWVWECGFRNWGMMRLNMKLEAREWDNEFHCFDLLADPEERVNLGEQACAPLGEIAREQIGQMPAAAWPEHKDLLWGPPAPSASAKP